ncbi:general transcription factor II-I repeat domain-containing protein 2-like [Centruroides vittatus]|uniref:general transcription factor II-I repeat domain-containing protein 2-like n=1 Tax=Centruroides vittatus TaxID=120091 RepID=UPI00351049CA
MWFCCGLRLRAVFCGLRTFAKEIKDFSVPKEYNFKRHYDRNRKRNYDQYVAKLREDKLSELKSLLQRQQSVFTKSVEDNTVAVKVSYILSHLIASRSKPFTEGEFITSRVDEIADNLRNRHNSTISTFQAYSIAIDESTDIRNITQLAVFIRGCDVNLKISEELLEIIPMHNTTTGADIFDALMEVLKKYKLPLEKLVCLATDGAPTTTGITKGVVARLKETCKQHGNNNFEHFHCIIHQQVLCSKVLNIGHVLKIVTKIVNYIRARQFASFLEHIECEYTDLPYYTEVRWLSSHKVLKRFFTLLDEIIIFLETKNYECAELKDGQWTKGLAFSVDITSHLNRLNLKLRGKNHVVTTLFDNINAFKQKLSLRRKQIEKENLSHFESSQYLLLKSPKLKFTQYAHQIKLLETEFDRRFSDFKSCELQFRLFTSSLSIDIETVDENLQMELIEIQCDNLLKQKYMDVGIPDFYTYLSVDRFPKMLSFVTRILAMFGSTYLCQQLFSLIKNNKNSERSRLTDQHLLSV